MQTLLRPPQQCQRILSRRTYAISVSDPKIFPKKHLPRKFGPTKTYQYNVCMRVLQSNVSSPLIFLQHTDFTAQRLVKLRRDILAASHRVVPPSPTGDSSASDPTLLCLRTGIFGAALRAHTGLDQSPNTISQLASSLTGPLLLLSLPLFNPPQLSAILRTLDRTLPPRKPKTPLELQKELEAKNADPATPGRRVKRVKPILQPELKVIGALIDGKVFLREGVRDVATLPTMETLRAQIVGLLSASGSQIVGVLGEAGGMKLARTLEGLRKGLEEDASA